MAGSDASEGQAVWQPGGAEEDSRLREGNRHLHLAYDEEGGVWNGLPRLAHSHAQSSATKTSVDLLSWAARVSGNERADRLASTADITSGLQLGRAEVLRGLRNFLSTDKPEHHSTDRLKERGEEKGCGRHSTLQGRQRSVFNQANIGTVSRATLGRLLRDGAERVWAFPSATMPS